jgi:SWI/SNF-related matrix-associated actin-dependent regulator 1 of chromatin subfamily A
MIPAYLNSIGEAEYYYGTLKYDDFQNSWIIEGEPCVIDMAKRLFPGCSGRGSGFARFPHNKRINGDLNWLMLRYPLRIEEPERWEKAYQEAVNHVVKRNELNKRPQKVTPPLEFNGELLEFQKEGLSFMLHNRRTLLADEMGTGKTPTALAFLATTESYPALIIVPPHLVRNWKREIKNFITLPGQQLSLLDYAMDDNERSSVHVIKGLKPYKLPKASIYIIHYLLLRGWKRVLPEMNFKAIVFDEIQDLRHSGTEKYSAASLVASRCENVIGLSGTPIYNRGGEIWNVMNILEYHCLGDWDSFTREWCTGYGSDVVKKPDLLGDYLKREGLLLRRTKEQVLKELPPKRRVVQAVDFDTGTYSNLIQEAISKAKGIDEIKDYFEKGRVTREVVNDSRQAIGIAKAPYVAEFVKMLLDAGERVLLFAYHHAVWDEYKNQLKAYNPVFITGKETSNQKDAAVEAFKNKRTNICCISLRAAAGIDGLQSATCVVFGELDWSPAIHSQAEDRVQRIGVNKDQDSILCYYLVAEEGTDETIQEFLGLKVSQFIGIMGDKEETEQDRMLAQAKATEHMNKIVEKLKQAVK